MREGPRLGSTEEFRFRRLDIQPSSGLPVPVIPAGPTRRRTRFGRWFFAALGLLLAALVCFGAVDFIEAQFARSTTLGALFTALFGAVLATALAWIGVEIRAYRSLREVEAARLMLLDGNPDAAASEVIDALTETLAHRPASLPDLDRFRRHAQTHHTREQLLAFFASDVLRPVDREAYAAIARAARDVGVVTAIAPTALLDATIMLWRTVRLVRQVAEIYGHRAGIAGTWFLLRRLASGAAIVAASDVAGNLIAQQLGGALADLLATKLGEGAVAATRTARIGLYAMQLCRVLPFGPDDAPTFRRLLESVLGRK